MYTVLSSLSGSKYSKEIIPGWFHSHKLYEMVVEKCNPNSVMVELGSYFGESTVYLARLLKEKGIVAEQFAVDLWEWDEWMDSEELYWSDLYWSKEKHHQHREVLDLYGTDMVKIINHYLTKYDLSNQVTLIKEDSISASRHFTDESVDFLYLDTEHTYSRVCQEVEAWFSKIKVNGIIAGDDLGRDDDGDGGVKRAVRELSGDDFSSDGTTWFYNKLG